MSGLSVAQKYWDVGGKNEVDEPYTLTKTWLDSPFIWLINASVSILYQEFRRQIFFPCVFISKC